jgi:hypothetical protein
VVGESLLTTVLTVEPDPPPPQPARRRAASRAQPVSWNQAAAGTAAPAYPEILAGNLAKVAGIVGDRCMVVPTIHGYTVNGIDNTGKNRVVAEFVASRPGTPVPDWAGTVATHRQPASPAPKPSRSRPWVGCRPASRS